MVPVGYVVGFLMNLKRNSRHFQEFLQNLLQSFPLRFHLEFILSSLHEFQLGLLLDLEVLSAVIAGVASLIVFSGILSGYIPKLLLGILQKLPARFLQDSSSWIPAEVASGMSLGISSEVPPRVPDFLSDFFYELLQRFL